MQKIDASELIINNRNAIYHLDMRPEELASTVILVGDPDRVKKVSAHFDSIEFSNQHREFISHTGYIGAKRITVLSTGIGPDNIDIVLNELDALVNIDFTSRQIKNTLSSLNIIRFGTSGSLQADIAVDSFVASTYGLGLDNLMNYYAYNKLIKENELKNEFVNQTGISNKITIPYIFKGCDELLNKFSTNFNKGITVTCPGFYGPQGRVLRLPLNSTDLINKLSAFKFNENRITNFEMETSAIYGLGKLLGHNCLSVNAIVANRVLKQFSKDSNKTVEKLIKLALEILTQ